MKKDSEKTNPYNISYDHYIATNACTECTGLIPSASADEEEWDSYREIFDFEAVPQKNTKDFPPDESFT